MLPVRHSIDPHSEEAILGIVATQLNDLDLETVSKSLQDRTHSNQLIESRLAALSARPHHLSTVPYPNHEGCYIVREWLTPELYEDDRILRCLYSYIEPNSNPDLEMYLDSTEGEDSDLAMIRLPFWLSNQQVEEIRNDRSAYHDLVKFVARFPCSDPDNLDDQYISIPWELVRIYRPKTDQWRPPTSAELKLDWCAHTLERLTSGDWVGVTECSHGDTEDLEVQLPPGYDPRRGSRLCSKIRAVEAPWGELALELLPNEELEVSNIVWFFTSEPRTERSILLRSVRI